MRRTICVETSNPEHSISEVPLPSEFGLPYEDLELETEDKVKLRCYLLPQKRLLSTTHPEAARVPNDLTETDDEVTSIPYGIFRLFSPSTTLVHC